MAWFWRSSGGLVAMEPTAVETRAVAIETAAIEARSGDVAVARGILSQGRTTTSKPRAGEGTSRYPRGIGEGWYFKVSPVESVIWLDSNLGGGALADPVCLSIQEDRRLQSGVKQPRNHRNGNRGSRNRGRADGENQGIPGGTPRGIGEGGYPSIGGESGRGGPANYSWNIWRYPRGLLVFGVVLDRRGHRCHCRRNGNSSRGN